MPGHHWSEAGVRLHDTLTTELDAHRRKVDAEAAALERRIFRSTTRDLRRESESPVRRPSLGELPTIDLIGDPDLDDAGRF